MVIDLLVLHIWLKSKDLTTYDYILLLRENENSAKKIKNKNRNDINH